MSSGRARLAAAAAGAAALVLIATWRGIGLSPDSISYLSAGRSMASGGGLRVWHGAPLTDWPPLYPALLALLARIGLDPAHAARGVAVVVHAATLGVAGAWLLTRSRSAPVAWAGIAALAVAPHLLWVSSWAWSESLFMLFTVGCLACLDVTVRRPDRRWIAAAAALAAGAALTRYVGVSVIGAGGLFLLLRTRGDLRRRVARAIGFTLVATGPLALWLLRNHTLTGTITGERAPGQWGLGFNLSRVLLYLSSWVLPPAGEGAWIGVAHGALLLLLGAALWLGARQLRSVGEGGDEPRDLEAMVACGLFLAGYVALLVWSATTVALDVLNHRLMAPLYPPLVILATLAADRALSATAGDRAVLRRTLAGAAAVWLLLTVPLTAQVLGQAAAGLGYRSPAWRSSELVAHLRNDPPRGAVYSNDAPGVYYLTGIPARWGPRRHVYNSPQTIPDDITPIREARAEGTAIALVWFRHVPPYFMAATEVESRLDVESVARTADGFLYRMR